MPKKSAYSVYRGAGAATGKYQASLYGVEDIWGKIESSRERSAFKQEQTGRTIDTLMSAVELGSQLYGGYMAKEEFKGTLKETQVSMAKSAYGKSELGTAKGAKKWGDLGEGVQSEWMEKFKPTKVEQSWTERLFGEEKKYTFGESEAFSKSEITAAGGLRKSESLEALMNIGGEDKYKDVLKIIEPEKVDEFAIKKTSPGGKYKAVTKGSTTEFVVPDPKDKPPVITEVKEADIGGGSMLQEAGLGGKPKTLQEQFDELNKQLAGQGFKKAEFGAGGQVWQD